MNKLKKVKRESSLSLRRAMKELLGSASDCAQSAHKKKDFYFFTLNLYEAFFNILKIKIRTFLNC